MAQPQPPAMAEMTIAGMKLQIQLAPTATNAMAWALFPMENRLTYPADKLSALLEAIRKAQKNKFELLTLALEDQDKLEDKVGRIILCSTGCRMCLRFLFMMMPTSTTSWNKSTSLKTTQL
jgi:hypothetical protein